MAIFENFDENENYVSRYYSRKRSKAEKREFAIEAILRDQYKQLTDIQKTLMQKYEVLLESGDQILARSLFGKGAIDKEDLTLHNIKKIYDVGDRRQEMEELIVKLSKYKDSRLLNPDDIRTHTGKQIGDMVRDYMSKLSRAEQKQLEAEYFDDSFDLVDLVTQQVNYLITLDND